MVDRSQPWDYFPLLPVYAFTDEKKFRKFVKKMTGTKATVLDKAAGQLSWYEADDGGFCAMMMDCENCSTVGKYAALAHECVHYAQYCEQRMGGKMDEETQAYTVQSAFLACIDQIGEEWFQTPQESKSSEG